MAHKLPKYPMDHAVGSVVAEGGSMCANCEYLRANNTCSQKLFIEWNGSRCIPAPIKNYCCDFWEVNPRVLDVRLEDVGL